MIFRRSIISIAANLLRSAFTLITTMLLARELRPDEYGTFVFLLVSFSALISLLDMGTASAFFTFISKRNRTRSFFNYYYIWIAVQFVLAAVLIQFILPQNWVNWIWQGEKRNMVLFAFVAVFLQRHVWDMVAQIGESHRYTLSIQTLNVIIATFYLICIVFLIKHNLLSIPNLLTLLIVQFLLASLVASYLCPIDYEKGHERLYDVWKEFWVYCFPLIPITILGMGRNFLEPWLLQKYGGSVEQAYFSVASQFSMVSMLASKSILKVVWKDIAEANELGEEKKLRLICERINLILFAIGAGISCFFIPWSSEIIHYFLGDKYTDGILILSIMLLFPPFLALSQINSTMFLALELTRPFVIITTFVFTVAIVTLYFFLAPSDAYVPGLGMGALGRALNAVAVGFFNVNLSIWWLMKTKNWDFRIGYQIIGMGLFLTAAFSVYYGVHKILIESHHLFIRMGSAFFFYLIICLFFLYLKPSLIGTNREKIHCTAFRLMSFIRSKMV